MTGLRYGLRSLKRSPGFFVTGTLVLALGIAAVTLTFSFANAFFLRPLPFRDPDALVHVRQKDARLGTELGVSVPNFLDFRARSTVFHDLGGYYSGTVDVVTEGRTFPVLFGRVTANLIGLLGVEPLLGRTFAPGEDQTGRDQVVILSESFWRGRFGASPSVIGKTLEIEAMPYTIVGVMRSDFAFPSTTTQVWTPFPLDRGRRPREANGPLSAVGRLAPGAMLRAAQNEMASLMEALAAEYPEANKGKTATVVPLRRALLYSYDRMQQGTALAAVAAGLLLIMVCANVGNLLLVRGAGRRREIAVRMAIGGSRLRVMGDLLAEAGLLALAGGAIGVALAAALLRALSPLVAEDLYRTGSLSVDGAVLSFSVLASVVSALACALAPAFRATGGNLSRDLKADGRCGLETPSGRKLGSALVVAQVAVALILLVGGALAVQSLKRLSDVKLGFNPENVLTLEFLLPTSKYPSAREHYLFNDAAVDRLRSLPGVTAVAYAYPLPLTGERQVTSFDTGNGERHPAQMFSVSPGYFAVMEIPLLGGRDVNGADSFESARVVVVNRKTAETFWPGTHAAGQTVRLAPGTPGERVATVVGVVGDHRHRVSEEPAFSIFVPQLQVGTRRRVLVVRTEGEQLSAAAARSAIEAIDLAVAITSIRTMSDVVSDGLLFRREGTRALAILGGVALGLAALGVYGVVSFVAGRRELEMGVRVALGAEPKQVATLVLYDGAALAAGGLALGLAGAAALTRLMESLLYDVSALDATSFAGAAFVITIATLVAAYLPARRASRVDPAAVLART